MGGLLRLLGLVLLVLVVHYPLFGDGAVMGRRAALGDNGLSHFNVTDSNRNVSAVHDHPQPALIKCAAPSCRLPRNGIRSSTPCSHDCDASATRILSPRGAQTLTITPEDGIAALSWMQPARHRAIFYNKEPSLFGLHFQQPFVRFCQDFFAPTLYTLRAYVPYLSDTRLTCLSSSLLDTTRGPLRPRRTGKPSTAVCNHSIKLLHVIAWVWPGTGSLYCMIGGEEQKAR
nr:hypothetical protein Iba_chr11bCG2550 [Ipomoea batatas]